MLNSYTTITVESAALATWFAQPLGRQQAERLSHDAATRAQQAYRQGRSALAAELEQAIAGFWLGQPTRNRLYSLAQRADPPQAAPLAALIDGQLLMSRRLQGAQRQLEQGFELARNLFLPGDFFGVLKRHELLAELPLGPLARPPMGLDPLLREARVIRRIRGERRRPTLRRDSGDTTA